MSGQQTCLIAIATRPGGECSVGKANNTQPAALKFWEVEVKLKIGTKTGLRYFGMTELRSWHPCYNPYRYLPETFRGTALSILDHDQIPPQDKIWVVLRTTLVSENLMRLFAVKIARLALSRAKKTDPRSFKACDVTEQFVLGQASREQLEAARSGAWDARRELWADAAYAAADAAADADADAAYAAAAYAYADAAAYAYAADAADAAYAAARQKAQIEQVAILREMVVAEGLTRVAAKKLFIESVSPTPGFIR